MNNLNKFVLALCAMFTFQAHADVLADIKAEGVLTVGVKADYKPYGYRDSNGDIVGIEPDLALEVAKALGVELEMIPVVASNRIEFLQQGKIDLMIATMSDNEKRRKVVDIIQPNYYSSGANVLAWKKAEFDSWEKLDGKPVCGVQGAYYNKSVAQKYGANIISFPGTPEALAALKQGSCLGFVYDDSFIVSKLSEDQWMEDFEMSLDTIEDQPWGVAVAQGEDEFSEFMSQIVTKWHQDGRILELETAYGVPNTPFAKTMHEKYKAQ